MLISEKNVKIKSYIEVQNVMSKVGFEPATPWVNVGSGLVYHLFNKLQ